MHINKVQALIQLTLVRFDSHPAVCRESVQSEQPKINDRYFIISKWNVRRNVETYLHNRFS